VYLVLWLFSFVICVCGCVFACMLVCVCVCLYGFCNVWVCVFAGFVLWGCFDNCVGDLVTRVLVFTVFLYFFTYVYLFLFVNIVRTTATECQLNCSK
jgi:hypothetical protein